MLYHLIAESLGLETNKTSTSACVFVGVAGRGKSLETSSVSCALDDVIEFLQFSSCVLWLYR